MENNFSQGDATQRMKASMDQLDGLRTEELQNAANLLQQKQEHLRLERQRLAAKYGEQYPAVQQIDARLQFEQERTQTVRTEAERSTIKTEPYTVASWRVNGLVLNGAAKGVEGVTVYLMDEKQQRLDGLPVACSDKQGYYAITLERVMVERAKGRTMFLGAFLKNTQKQVTTTDALQARVGVIDYRDIDLTEGTCDTPPQHSHDKEDEK